MLLKMLKRVSVLQSRNAFCSMFYNKLYFPYWRMLLQKYLNIVFSLFSKFSAEVSICVTIPHVSFLSFPVSFKLGRSLCSVVPVGVGLVPQTFY